MATITISVSNTSVVTGSKSYTVSDADLQLLLSWAAAHFATSLPQSPTNAQILLAWVQGWINQTKSAVQSYQVAVPPQITIA